LLQRFEAIALARGIGLLQSSSLKKCTTSSPDAQSIRLAKKDFKPVETGCSSLLLSFHKLIQ